MVCEQERDWRRRCNAFMASYPLPVGRDCLTESLVEEALVTEVKSCLVLLLVSPVVVREVGGV